MYGILLAKKYECKLHFFRMTDDQGSADVGFRNPDSVFVTPNLDALAADAVRLSNYYVHPTCSPTRAALMTGETVSNFIQRNQRI